MFAVSIFADKSGYRAHVTHWSIAGGKYGSVWCSDLHVDAGVVPIDASHREAAAYVLQRLAEHMLR